MIRPLFDCILTAIPPIQSGVVPVLQLQPPWWCFFLQIIYLKDISSDVSHKKIGSSGGGNYTLQQLPQQQAEPAAAGEPRPNSAFFCVPTSSLFRGRRRTMYKKRSRGSEECLKTEERLKLTFSRHAGLSRARFVHGTGSVAAFARFAW